MGKGRAPCCDQSKVKKGPWSPEEDLKLISFVKRHGHPNWRSLPKRAGLLRCGKSCRLRWVNYLRPDLKRGNFTKEEEETVIKLYQSLGSKWSKIASCLPGRTDNEIKNVWNTHLKKRLINQKNLDHIAAKPEPESSSTNSSSFSPSFSSSSTSSIPAVKEDIRGSQPKPACCSSSSSISSTSSSSSASNYSNSIGTPTDDHVPIPKDEMDKNSLPNLGGGTTTTCEGFNSSDQQVIEIPTDDRYAEIDLWDMLGVPMQTNEYSNLEGSKFGEEYDLSRDFEWSEWLRSMENRLGIEESAATSDGRDLDVIINPTKNAPAGQGNSHFQMWFSPPQNFGF